MAGVKTLLIIVAGPRFRLPSARDTLSYLKTVIYDACADLDILTPALDGADSYHMVLGVSDIDLMSIGSINSIDYFSKEVVP